MTDPLPFINPAEGLRELILANFPDLLEINVGLFPGTALGDKLPYIAIEVQGGGQDYFTDEPLVDMDFFATTHGGANLLAGEVTSFFLRYPQSIVVGTRRFTIDRVGVVRRSVKEPWDDENIGRESATFQFTIRR